MKAALFLALLLLMNISPSLADGDIPHYRFYPRTPPVPFRGEILDFYSVRDLYGEFSNFALFPLLIEGVQWPSSEHFYQAQKFLDPELRERVRLAPSPYQAAKLGRDPGLPLRADWDDVRDGYMEIAVRAKFSQYAILRELLRSTGLSRIYEHTGNDCYWADCLDRTGQNKLGLLLMKLREDLSIQKE